MPKVTVYDMGGNKVDEIELSEAIFGIEPHEHVLHDAVVMQQASQRRGTHAVKNRSEVRGGGRKEDSQGGDSEKYDRGEAGVAAGGDVVGGDFLEYDLDGHRSAKGGHGTRPGE